MKLTTQNVGRLGEDMAAEFLRKKSYTIVQRNFRFARGEIDIVASKDNVLIFVEVKTARGKAFGAPELWVDERKQKQIGMVAEKYLQETGAGDQDCRFDVIAIDLNETEPEIRHIENAFWL